uniref:Uncharacterized protein n=1 Tax=Cacopsylla melanoneura TaxID=428564 RepID=A0A8D8Z137_9HEMI
MEKSQYKRSNIPKAQKKNKPRTSSSDVHSNLLPLEEKIAATSFNNPDLTESLVDQKIHCNENSNEINTPSPDSLPPPRPVFSKTLLKPCRKIEFSPSSSVDEKADKKVEFEPNAFKHLCDSNVEDTFDQTGIIPTKRHSLSLSASLVDPNMDTNSSNEASIKEQVCREGHSRSTSSKSEGTCDLFSANSSMDDDMDKYVNRALAYDYTSSSWDYLGGDFDDKSYSDEDFDDKSSFKYSDEDFDDKSNYIDPIVEPVSTSTPFKSQPIKPDVINVERENEIEKLLDYGEEKISNISHMLSSMKSETELLNVLAKQKESNFKLMSETLQDPTHSHATAEDLTYSICSGIELFPSDLHSSWRSSEGINLGKYAGNAGI